MQMTYGIMLLILLAGKLGAEDYDATQWNYKNTPLNYDNSTLNYDNSTLNWKNSPLNYDNSTLNPRRKNLYTEDGDTIGYIVEKENGGSNLFTNQGKRIGYEPADPDNE